MSLSEQIEPDAAIKFLSEAATYFARRPTGGEDAAFWANVANAETCQRIAALLAAERHDLASHPVYLKTTRRGHGWTPDHDGATRFETEAAARAECHGGDASGPLIVAEHVWRSLPPSTGGEGEVTAQDIANMIFEGVWPRGEVIDGVMTTVWEGLDETAALILSKLKENGLSREGRA